MKRTKCEEKKKKHFSLSGAGFTAGILILIQPCGRNENGGRGISFIRLTLILMDRPGPLPHTHGLLIHPELDGPPVPFFSMHPPTF
jgi:hypothetical protein